MRGVRGWRTLDASIRAVSVTAICPLEIIAAMYWPRSSAVRGNVPAGMPRPVSIALASAQ